MGVVLVALALVRSLRFESQFLAIDLVAYPIHLVLQRIRERRDDFEVLLEGFTQIEYFR